MDMGEECGIAAISMESNISTNTPFLLYKMLLNLQNRGQLSAGMTTHNPERSQIIDTYRHLGTVNEAFGTSNGNHIQKVFERYKGNMGIGHVRYATSGVDDKSYAQPFERHHGRKWKWFSFCFNGNLANYIELKESLKKSDYHLIRETDTELIMHYISKEIMSTESSDMVNIFSNLSEKFDGAYNIAFVNAEGKLAVLRDPLGIKPLSYGFKRNPEIPSEQSQLGKDEGLMLAASESNALINCGVKEFQTLEPGHMILVENGNPEIVKFAKSPRKAHCMFEWVYFSNVSSVIDGKSVYLTRINLGKELAKLEIEKINDEYVVVGVPDSSKPIADGFAFELGLPSKEGLIRNRYVGRVFIDGKDKREAKIKDKFTVLKEIVNDKKVLLIDDSIVRGTTSKELVRFLKKTGGAKEVHMRVACPPIVCPCFYGIDMSTISELIASKFVKNVSEDITQEECKKLAEEIGADSVIYNTKADLVRSIGLPKSDLCLACISGDYLTPCGKDLYQKALEDFKKGETKRTYE
ncbi:MAG: amidophosphoribosyltransferase [Candidatus Aenigmarchaeota archaeon]|nr:amidophosphoribosyltransferase [Candidatus Aenigmarchaeota archaeon]